jgi:hypothetical protein
MQTLLTGKTTRNGRDDSRSAMSYCLESLNLDVRVSLTSIRGFGKGLDS